jgi:hypothetical protein
MTAILRLATPATSRDDVLRAWATYRALQLAEVDDPTLANDLQHQQAKAEANERHHRLYSEWCRR